MNRKILTTGILSIVLSLWSMVYGQDIPIGTWRLHVSYSDIHSISVTPSEVYAAALNGVMIFDRAENTIRTLTKLDGLSSINITQVEFDQQRSQLLITYADGDIDIVKNNEVINFNSLKNSETISGPKRINHISIRGDFAYLSTDFGVVVFDLLQLAIKETWRDIGIGGAELEINQSTFYNDSIFLATETGVLAGNINDNLLDYNNWKRFTTGAFNGNIQSITTFNDAVYAAINGSGIHRYDGHVWQLEPYVQALQYKSLTADELLVITTASSLFRITSSGIATEVISSIISDPQIASEDQNGKLWIGDSQNGLVSDYTGSFVSISANGPTFSQGLNLQYNNLNKTMYALSGGFSNSLTPLGREENVNKFSDGSWNIESDILNKDITGFLANSNKQYVASCGYGLQVIQQSGTILFDETNSPLQNVAAGRNVRVTDIAASDRGVWVTNAGAIQPLHVLKADNTWESFSFPAIAAARYPTHIEVDYLGNVWMAINPANGGGVAKQGSIHGYPSTTPLKELSGPPPPLGGGIREKEGGHGVRLP